MLLLAQLYEAGGEWPKARSRLQDLVQKNADNPGYLAAYVSALIRHKQLDEAKAALGKLEALASGKPAVLEIQARLLKARGEGEKAATLITEFALRDGTRVIPAARLCEELDQHDAAERLYRLALEKADARRPVEALVLASFLGRRGRAAEAMDLLDRRAWGSLPPSTSRPPR